jgi:hypothetical protein
MELTVEYYQKFYGEGKRILVVNAYFLIKWGGKK